MELDLIFLVLYMKHLRMQKKKKIFENTLQDGTIHMFFQNYYSGMRIILMKKEYFLY